MTAIPKWSSDTTALSSSLGVSPWHYRGTHSPDSVDNGGKISIPKLHMFFFHVPSDQRIRSIYVCSLFLTDSMSFIHKMLDKYLLNLIHKTSVLLLHSHTIYCYRKNFNFIFFSKTEIEIDFFLPSRES